MCYYIYVIIYIYVYMLLYIDGLIVVEILYDASVYMCALRGHRLGYKLG